MSHPRSARAPLTPGWADRTGVLVVLVGLLGVAFTASYEGALHKPHPKDLPVGVVAPAPVVAQLARTVAEQTDVVRIVPAASAAQARRRIRGRAWSGAVVVGALPAHAGTPAGDLVMVTEVPSRVVSEAVGEVVRTVEARLARRYDVVTLNRFATNDPLGLGVFYLAISMVVAAYLLAAMLAFTQREAETLPTWGARLIVLGAYSVAVGGLAVLIVGPWLGILDRHVAQLAGVAMFLTFAVLVTVTMLEVAFGAIYGTGVAIGLFVILGNPSAGGPFPRSMLPAFFRAVGAWLPTGFGTDAFRSIMYGAGDLVSPLLKMTLYTAVGVIGTAALVARRGATARSSVSPPDSGGQALESAPVT